MEKPMARHLAAALALVAAGVAGAAEPARGLDVWFIDTEGGAATLIVTPAGESVLIDNGNPGARDAERIKTVCDKAGVKAIDHQVITHWHLDHYGGTARLAELVPIRRYHHRGIPDSLDEDKANFPVLIRAFKQASSGKDNVLKPGDVLPLKQADGAPKLELLCLCANEQTVPDAPGAPANPLAAGNTPDKPDPSDNAKSLGFRLSYGGFRYVNLGDLTWNIEYKLVSPTDKVGPVDLFQASHHGLEISNNTALLKTLRPKVVVFANGPRKGAHARVLGDLRRLPEPPAIFQVHKNLTVGDSENTEPSRIANAGGSGCKAEPVKASVAADAKSYAVTVGWEGKPERFAVRAP
jgi:competence protein ComEC